MDRALPIAVGVGVIACGAVFGFGEASVYAAIGVGALYTGWAYFVVQYPALLSREAFVFDRSTDKLGYAIGLFGAGIFGVVVTNGLDIEFFAGYLGVIGVLLTSSAAHEYEAVDGGL
ncbi:hypothetical protein [Natrinema marinum]|uniref:hypothetical protein n=1 Tax=Natrinema marinum TaxID=2961598 RepID=UPI0020C8D1B1|nr:hypothetical protein [Natrinema marinum]